MPTSQIGKAALIARESVELEAYLDSVGIWTIGVGHTAAAGGIVPRKGIKITYAQALSLFDVDIKKYEKPVDELNSKLAVKLTENEYDALVSLSFNLGEGIFKGKKQASFVKAIIAGKRGNEVSTLILRYTKPPEVKTRRQGEADQFVTPYSVMLPKARRNDKSSVKVNIPQKFVNSTTIAPPLTQSASSLGIAGQLAKVGAWFKGYKTPNVTQAFEMPPGFHGDLQVGNIQASLRAKGYVEVGKIDGFNGDDTQGALKNLIRDNGDTVQTKSSLLKLTQETLEYIRTSKGKTVDPARGLAGVLEVANNVPEAMAPIKTQTGLGLGMILGPLGLGGASSALQSVKDMADTARNTAATANDAIAQAQPILDFIVPKVMWIENHLTLVMVGIGGLSLLFVSSQTANIIQLFRTKRIN